MTLNPPADLVRRCQPIELLVTDVDGVLTDGKIIMDDRGIEIKHFHVRDGLAFSLWHKAGRQSAIISGRKAPAVNIRASDLKIAHVFLGCEQKDAPLRTLIARLGLSPHQACYVGDDLPDLSAFSIVGLSACPADAAEEVKAAAHFVTQASGGQGTIREIVELILKAQGTWSGLIDVAGSASILPTSV